MGEKTNVHLTTATPADFPRGPAGTGNVERVTGPDVDTSVVVVGAGQAGLSVAFYLRRLGLDPGNEFVLLDRGPGTGGAWQFRWEALRLGYAHKVHDLPGMEELGVSFDTADKSLPAKDVVADYYRAYEEHYELQVVRPAEVTRVEMTAEGFVTTFEGPYGVREVSSRVLVNAPRSSRTTPA